MPSLLDKALKSSQRRTRKTHFSDEERELILAWVADEISIAQAASAIGRTPYHTTLFLANGLKAIVNENSNGIGKKK